MRGVERWEGATWRQALGYSIAIAPSPSRPPSTHSASKCLCRRMAYLSERMDDAEEGIGGRKSSRALGRIITSKHSTAPVLKPAPPPP